jgi:hypothetical protein
MKRKLFVDEKVLFDMYKSGLTFREIADEIGNITSQRIHQIIKSTGLDYKKPPKPKPAKKRGTLENRFLSYVDKSDNCWIWKGTIHKNGYGRLHIGKKSCYAHRVSWYLKHGEIPIGLCVCHTCDNPLCVNPSHLWLGTIADNMHDRDKKGRGGKRKAAKSCKLSNI